MATQPTTPPSVTAWPTSPSRARPSTFAAEADAFLGHFPVGQADQEALVTWLNTTAGQSYTNALEAAASATTASNSEDAAAQSVIDANAILSSAFSQANFKGNWSSLSGALNIPASVSHNGGVWLLTTNLANVTASEPSEVNANWLLIFRQATDLDVESGTQYAHPDAKQLKGFVQRDWSSLTTAKTYNESCFYRGKEYAVRNPIDDVTIAPPDTLGRSYFEFDGSDDFITIPTINLVAGDVVKFKFRAPNQSKAGSLVFITDGVSATDRAAFYYTTSSTIASFGNTILDSVNYGTSISNPPFDGLIHRVEVTLTTAKILGNIGRLWSGGINFLGRIYDLEVIRGGNRIHYFPLRTDAIDYLAGNLVKDEEFTWEGNWSSDSNTINTQNNALNFDSAPISKSGFTNTPTRNSAGTYRYLYEYIVTTGGVRASSFGLPVWDINKTVGSGVVDSVVVHDSVGTGVDGFTSTTANTTATIKNFRVIKLNELSPSASFNSASGFTLAGGVTITGGQAVFGAGTGVKKVEFSKVVSVGKKVRVVYKVNGTTTGTFRFEASGSQGGTYRSSDGVYDQVITLIGTTTGFNVITTDGWDGNVEYFSVTEVTDGTENGSPVKTFDKSWQLTSGEQFLPSSAGLVKFGDNLVIDSNNTLEIEPLSNGSRGDTIKLARKEGFTPIVKLSAADITAGKLIRSGVLTDAELTLDTNKVATLIHNGTDLEVKV